MGRRGRNEGSLYRRKDGLWVGQYKVHIASGTKYKYIYGRDRKVVARRLARAIADRDSGLVYDSQSLTLSEYLEKWLLAVRETISEGSWKQYKSIVKVHISPALGRTKLDRLTPLQVQTLYTEKLRSGLSRRRVIYIHVTLHKALKQAVRWSLLPRNVTDAVDPPRLQKKEIEPFDESQVKTLLSAARGERFEALYILAITTGLRQGELLGLKWKDMDLETSSLRVNRTVFNGVVSPPKTAKSRRTIRLSKLALEALREQREGSQDVGRDAWIFSTSTGRPVGSSNLINRSWKPLLKRAGFADRRFHNLRHTCATLLLTKGVHPKIVQELLGHSNISITLDTYSHVLPNIQGEAVRAIESYFPKSSGG